MPDVTNTTGLPALRNAVGGQQRANVGPGLDQSGPVHSVTQHYPGLLFGIPAVVVAYGPGANTNNLIGYCYWVQLLVNNLTQGTNDYPGAMLQLAPAAEIQDPTQLTAQPVPMIQQVYPAYNLREYFNASHGIPVGTVVMIRRMYADVPVSGNPVSESRFEFEMDPPPSYGFVVCKGPKGEANYTDNRYWVQRAYQTNTLTDSTAQLTYQALTALQPNYEIVTVENLFERNARTHHVKPGTLVRYRLTDALHHECDVMDEGDNGQSCSNSSSGHHGSSGHHNGSSGHHNSGSGVHHNSGSGVHHNSGSGSPVTGFQSGYTGGCGSCPQPDTKMLTMSGWAGTDGSFPCSALNGTFTLLSDAMYGGVCYYAAGITALGASVAPGDPTAQWFVNVECGTNPMGVTCWIISLGNTFGVPYLTIYCTGGGPSSPSGAHGTGMNSGPCTNGTINGSVA